MYVIIVLRACFRYARNSKLMHVLGMLLPILISFFVSWDLLYRPIKLQLLLLLIFTNVYFVFHFRSISLDYDGNSSFILFLLRSFQAETSVVDTILSWVKNSNLTEICERNFYKTALFDLRTVNKSVFLFWGSHIYF